MKKKIIILVMLFSIIVSVFAMSALAADDVGTTKEKGIYYTLRSDGTAIVTEHDEDAGSVIEIPGKVSFNGTDYTVTELGQQAFYPSYANDNITSVKLPDSVSSIHYRCFLSCESLKTINLGKVTSIGESALEDCRSLTSADLRSAASIGESAFYNCRNLASVTLPSSSIAISDFTFTNCTSLKTINLSKVSTIGKQAFFNCWALPSPTLGQVTAIGESAFESCKTFENVTFPASLTLIGDKALAYCEKLESVTFMGGKPDGLSDNVFKNSKALTEINVESKYEGDFKGALESRANLVKPFPVATTLSEGNLWIIIAVVVLATASIAALVVVKKKKTK